MAARYIYPPRPRSTIHPRQLPEEEARGVWLWQRKFNGDRCVAIVENRSVRLCNRHGKFRSKHLFSTLQKEISALNLPPGLTYLDGELLESKDFQILVFFDVLQIGGNYLLGVNQVERLLRLRQICREPRRYGPDELALEISKSLWLADFGDHDLSQHFREKIDHPLIEGLVLRRKDSVLDNWGSSEYEVDWQLRCRKAAKNYPF